MNLQMLKKAMLAYVSAVKFIWSAIAYPLSIVGKKLMNLRGYKVYGNSVQDGTPTPDNPVEIECVGDLSTKNLLDMSKYTTTSSHLTYNPETEILTSNLALAADSSCFHSNIETLKAGTYTMSCEVLLDQEKAEYCGQINLGVIGYNESGTRTVYYKGIYISKTPNVWIRIGAVLNVDSDIDMSGTEYHIGIRIQAVSSSAMYRGLNLQIRNIMIAEGDVATDYEPYHKYKIPVVARGKNLIKLNTKSYSANGGTIINNKDGTYTLSGTPTGHCGLVIGSIPSSLLDVLRNNVCVLTGFYYYEKNVRITLNVKLNGSYIKYIYLNPYTYKNYVQVDLRTTEFDEITFSLSNQKNNVDFKNVTVKPLLEVGTTMPTSFEPYREPITKNIFLDEPLRKVGGYADYIDYEKQKVVRNVEVLDDTGTKTIDESLGVINPPTEETVKLPALPQFKGTTIYEVGTNIKPSGMEAKYC